MYIFFTNFVLLNEFKHLSYTSCLFMHGKIMKQVACVYFYFQQFLLHQDIYIQFKMFKKRLCEKH